jgi:hypothetical protein
MSYYILDTVPNARNGVSWASICHASERLVFIRHEPTRDTSRWVSVARKRPFIVTVRTKRASAWITVSSHATLAAAELSATTINQGVK